MAKLKEVYEEFAFCLRIIIGAACFFVGHFVLVVGLTKAVTVISFALPLQFLKLFGLPKKLFYKDLNFKSY